MSGSFGEGGAAGCDGGAGRTGPIEPIERTGALKKAERMEEFLGKLDGSGTVTSKSKSKDAGVDLGKSEGASLLHPCYLGYFECFNSQLYYEAHDVLEHLWLKEGRDASDYRFHKGLIQLAGGFVHLKLQFTHPDHPKHGRRLHPARRLFLLSIDNLAPYGKGGVGGVGSADGLNGGIEGTGSEESKVNGEDHKGEGRHHGLDLEFSLSLAREMVAFIEEGSFERNPWNPERPPILPLPLPFH